MKKYPIKLVSQGARQILRNASDIIQESEILYKKGHHPRAYFLAQIGIEELGKLSMLIASIQYPEEYKEFWNLFGKLLKDHNFKISKAEISKQNHNYNFQVNLESRKIFKNADLDHCKKMSSLYTDFGRDGIISPSAVITRRETLGKINEAKEKFLIFKSREDDGYHNVNALKEIEKFYKDPEIREIQDKLFLYKSIEPEEYLKLIFERAKNMENSRLIEAFKELASYINFNKLTKKD